MDFFYTSYRYSLKKQRPFKFLWKTLNLKGFILNIAYLRGYVKQKWWHMTQTLCLKIGVPDGIDSGKQKSRLTVRYLTGALMNYPCLFCPSDNLEHRLALPTRSHASVRALSYWYLLSDPRRCEMNRKVRAPRRSARRERHTLSLG